MRYDPKYTKPLLFGGMGILLLLLGMFLLKDQFDSGGVEIVDNANTDTSTSSAIISNSGNIVVEVSGAINKPGVYHFPSGSRIDDALNIAGGLTSEANQSFVDQSINRAAKLIDGQKIYIPKNSEKVSPILGTSTENKLININAASESELDTLPGVGPVTAQKIISNRPYGSLEELTSKKVVSSKVFEEIKSKINLY